MTSLEELLAGREERASLQNSLLQCSDFVCQITLNIPGVPKRIENDEEAVSQYALKFLKLYAQSVTERRELENGAGFAILMGFIGDAVKAKRAAAELEEGTAAGRAFDIDIITKDGPISRTALGLPERACLLCGQNAKQCARERRHGAEELREAIRKLLKEAVQEPSG